MPISIKISNRVIKAGYTAKVLALNPLLYVRDISNPVDSSRYKRVIMRIGDSIRMPANDLPLIAALTAANQYDRFYQDNATPKDVPISQIVSNYNLFINGNTLIVFDPDSDFLQAFTDDNVYIKQL